MILVLLSLAGRRNYLLVTYFRANLICENGTGLFRRTSFETHLAKLFTLKGARFRKKILKFSGTKISKNNVQRPKWSVIDEVKVCITMQMLPRDLNLSFSSGKKILKRSMMITGGKIVGVDLGLVGLRKHYKGSMTRSLSLCWWSCAADVYWV